MDIELAVIQKNGALLGGGIFIFKLMFICGGGPIICGPGVSSLIPGN